ncbi:MAG: succinate dehydrogenase/fumarate reductase iron-sulfur subunit [Armatimonadota bacterium]|nr:succinate dehydrogenase/fumarate reductase iron-sulfur subunit [Armatimonadota bacterium]MDR7534137.1 succinate dehydrogenase/fumarate reductase iron-sulfur subunit [Armatimonadota bacterium]MDR7535829.1 succinate dehydrogenase/fumarate reductase iron-sulfur subunit [Armatimonadota bacterium]
MREPTITLDVWRYRPERDAAPSFQSFQIPYRPDWVVLDALNYIKDHVDGSVAFRWSCRMGVCGSCGMMINGVPRLSCAAFLKDYYPRPVRVEPLANFPVERDLIIDLTDFMEKLPAVRPWIIRQDAGRPDAEFRQTPAQLEAYRQFSMCINCLLCYAACPVYALEPRFLGPAALALAARYNLDSRDEGRAERHEVVAGPDGVWDCTFVGECTTVCPKDVDPAGAIQRLKLASALEWARGLLLPWGRR